jgi:RNA polymerase sigma-70 factor (ECF subfamily)
LEAVNVEAGHALAFNVETNTSSSAAQEPFERLFMQEYPKVVAIAQRVLNERQEAEDVAQEVFLAFHRGHQPTAGYAAPWLRAAAAHRALNRLRDERRRQERERRHALDPSASTETDPEHALEASEQRRVVRAALGRLRSKYATVLALRYSGLSYAEVAEGMGVGIGQVGTLLRRAEALLQKEVERVSSQ